MQWQTECLYCGGYMYRLHSHNIKCSQCKKKLSIKRVNTVLFLMEAFLDNKSALDASKLLHISYVCAKNYYQDFRMLCANISEEHYMKIRDNAVEYEEYFYLEKSKKHKSGAIFDAYNFLTFDYNGYIYTLLMPSLQKYKNQFLEDNLEDTYTKEFKKFQRASKLIRLSNKENKILDFWKYFEKSILVYKGVSHKLFDYYLKEFEFKFNYSKEEALELLIQNYFKEQT
ncbi:transposase [Sulfurimonas sp. NW7]|uniref:transposase n=1 Tax=unclassified Sulfurimonas TaxID=2623549 RepID=UPI003DA9E967